MAAPHAAEIPTARIASAKEAEARVAPAVVEAVAADINAPDTGAIIISLKWACSSSCRIQSFRVEFLITPAIVPVPIKSTATVDIFWRPYSILGRIFFHCFMQRIPQIPPMGRAIRGSMVIPAKGRRASKMIVTKGAIRLLVGIV